MSAICGIYNLDGKYINTEITTSLMNASGIYAADAADSWQNAELFFGCHLQHHTPESLKEKLPYFDSMADMAITADAILDNRAELFNQLNIHQKDRASIPDSVLILKAYQKWNKECPQHLLGDFAFAIWDGKAQQVFCSVDHTGNRTLYYYQSSKVFIFSTLIKPLFSSGDIKKQYSDPWICDYLSIPAVTHQLDSELTIYKDVLLLPAAHTLTVSQQGVRKKAYWQVTRKKPLKLKTDQEYEEAFRDILGRAVSCRLRSNKSVGIMLSGGLDSASVACIAAHELQKSGRTLQSFSSIPIKEYHNSLPANIIADETPFIEAIREACDNIQVSYCRFEGQHSLSDTDRLLAVLEQPYKILENLFWIDGILGQARDKNVGVMLIGGAGNITISYGIFTQCILSLWRSGKWIRLIKEIKAYSQLKKINPMRIAVNLSKALFPYEMQKAWYKKRNHNWDMPLQLSPINPEFAGQMGASQRFKKFGYDPFYIEQLDSYEYRRMMLAPFNLSHLASIYTKISLANNIIMRDPTLDKRVIDFCMSVPDEQYIRNGQDRNLLRRAMQGVLPDAVRLNTRTGQQSADFIQRLQPLEQAIITEARQIGRLEIERKYMDIARIHKKAARIRLGNEDTAQTGDIRMLLRSIIFSRYLNIEDV